MFRLNNLSAWITLALLIGAGSIGYTCYVFVQKTYGPSAAISIGETNTSPAPLKAPILPRFDEVANADLRVVLQINAELQGKTFAADQPLLKTVIADARSAEALSNHTRLQNARMMMESYQAIVDIACQVRPARGIDGVARMVEGPAGSFSVNTVCLQADGNPSQSMASNLATSITPRISASMAAQIREAANAQSIILGEKYAGALSIAWANGIAQ